MKLSKFLAVAWALCLSSGVHPQPIEKEPTPCPRGFPCAGKVQNLRRCAENISPEPTVLPAAVPTSSSSTLTAPGSHSTASILASNTIIATFVSSTQRWDGTSITPSIYSTSSIMPSATSKPAASHMMTPIAPGTGIPLVSPMSTFSTSITPISGKAAATPTSSEAKLSSVFSRAITFPKRTTSPTPSFEAAAIHTKVGGLLKNEHNTTAPSINGSHSDGILGSRHSGLILAKDLVSHETQDFWSNSSTISWPNSSMIAVSGTAYISVTGAFHITFDMPGQGIVAERYQAESYGSLLCLSGEADRGPSSAMDSELINIWGGEKIGPGGSLYMAYIPGTAPGSCDAVYVENFGGPALYMSYSDAGSVVELILNNCGKGLNKLSGEVTITLNSENYRTTLLRLPGACPIQGGPEYTK